MTWLMKNAGHYKLMFSYQDIMTMIRKQPPYGSCKEKDSEQTMY